VVTHLPTIAARADRHLVVAKRTKAGIATSDVETVRGEDRVSELSRMLGDADAETARAPRGGALESRLTRISRPRRARVRAPASELHHFSHHQTWPALRSRPDPPAPPAPERRPRTEACVSHVPRAISAAGVFGDRPSAINRPISSANRSRPIRTTSVGIAASAAQSIGGESPHRAR